MSARNFAALPACPPVLPGRPPASLRHRCPPARRFMKLRLDRVLRIELGPMTADEAAASTAELPKMTPPAKWTAPYVPYSYGWWDVFMKK